MDQCGHHAGIIAVTSSRYNFTFLHETDGRILQFLRHRKGHQRFVSQCNPWNVPILFWIYISRMMELWLQHQGVCILSVSLGTFSHCSWGTQNERRDYKINMPKTTIVYLIDINGCANEIKRGVLLTGLWSMPSAVRFNMELVIWGSKQSMHLNMKVISHGKEIIH